MPKEQDSKGRYGEKRDYFRIDDVIPVIANPVGEDKLQYISRSLSLSDMPSTHTPKDVPADIADSLNSLKLSELMMEIKVKLDFLINHFLFEREGLLSAQKKHVNMSASGIRFTVEHPVKVKDILEVKLLLPTYPPVAVFAYGEVKRVRILENNKYDVSLQYLNMAEKVRDDIIQYILTRQREIMKTRKNIDKK